MKKLLLLLLLAPMIGKSQMLNLPVKKVHNFLGADLATYRSSNGKTVPQGKVWQYVSVSGEEPNSTDSRDRYGDSHPLYAALHFYSDDGGVHLDNLQLNKYFVLSQGTTLFITSDLHDQEVISIIEYDLEAQNLASNVPQLTTPILYPNPTSSLLALNSDKEYDIEIYDMAGNKVMALTGNTIDMSDLSSATYIVKALDKVENEEVSYKVVKN